VRVEEEERGSAARMELGSVLTLLLLGECPPAPNPALALPPLPLLLLLPLPPSVPAVHA